MARDFKGCQRDIRGQQRNGGSNVGENIKHTKMTMGDDWRIVLILHIMFG